MGMREARFTTLDVYLAAYLKMRGFPLSLDNRGGKVVFAFTSSPSLNELISEFNSNALVQVADFTTAVKALRGQMLQARNFTHPVSG